MEGDVVLYKKRKRGRTKMKKEDVEKMAMKKEEADKLSNKEDDLITRHCYLCGGYFVDDVIFEEEARICIDCYNRLEEEDEDEYEPDDDITIPIPIHHSPYFLSLSCSICNKNKYVRPTSCHGLAMLVCEECNTQEIIKAYYYKMKDLV